MQHRVEMCVLERIGDQIDDLQDVCEVGYVVRLSWSQQVVVFDEFLGQANPTLD